MNVQSKPPTILQKFCMTTVYRLLKKINIGQLALNLPDGQVQHFGARSSTFSAEITILDYRFFTDFILRGDVGLGESFMAGIWDTKDIPLLFRLFIKNRRALREGNPAASWLLRQKNRLWQFAHNNTLIGSRRNIQYHYDLSNEFFRQFLDPSML